MSTQRFEYIIKQNTIPQFKLEHVIKQHIPSFQLEITPINDTLSRLSLSFTSDDATRLFVYQALEQFFTDNSWWFGLPTTKVPDEWYLQELDETTTIVVEEINETLAQDGEVFRGNINQFRQHFNQELEVSNLPIPHNAKQCIQFCKNYGYKISFISKTDRGGLRGSIYRPL